MDVRDEWGDVTNGANFYLAFLAKICIRVLCPKKLGYCMMAAGLLGKMKRIQNNKVSKRYETAAISDQAVATFIIDVKTLVDCHMP